MRHFIALGTLVLFVSATANAQQSSTKPQGTAQPAPRAQESEKTTMTTTTTTVGTGGWDFLNGLWSIDDTTTVPANQVHLRFSGHWVPEPASGDDDDFIVNPSIFWGLTDQLQFNVSVPVWVGDGGDRGVNPDGNADTYVGFVWRIHEQEGYWPSVAVGPSARIPTGDGSDKVDGDLRFILSNEYDSCIRSHVTGNISTINGTNNPNSRDFQWGIAVGVDGPINDDVRWVVDYVNRSSTTNGQNNINGMEAGLEWRVAEAHTVGFSTSASLDHSAADAADYGFNLTWSWAVVR